MDKFTNILVIYSAFAIFLIPIIQSLFFAEVNCYVLHHISFYGFIALFILSLANTVRFLIPVEVAYLIEPRIYYEKFRLSYEAEGRKQAEVDKLIKASYIDELEEAVNVNNRIFKPKLSLQVLNWSRKTSRLIPTRLRKLSEIDKRPFVK